MCLLKCQKIFNEHFYYKVYFLTKDADAINEALKKIDGEEGQLLLKKASEVGIITLQVDDEEGDL